MKLPAQPTHSNLHLDTRFHIHATDGKGNLLKNDLTGQPITIAQDMISGLWFAKVTDSMPFFGTKAQKEGLQELIDNGGIHVPHDDERFRGVWVPLDEAERQTDDEDGDEGDENGAGDELEPPAVPATPAPAPRRGRKPGVKQPAKKAAKKSTRQK